MVDQNERSRQTPSDHELYLAFLKGDNSSFDELMIRYGDSLTYYLAGKLGNIEEAEDMMIEAFARIMVKKPKIGEGNFKAYLYKTARHLVSHFHMKRSRYQVFSLDDMDLDPEGGPTPDHTVIDEERRKILNACMDRIDPDMKEALWLYYFEDLSYDEISSVMNINRKKADNLLSRGKQRLKIELEKEGIDNAHI